MNNRLSRRGFLRLSSISLIGAAFRPAPAVAQPRPLFYGRVIFIYATIYSRPSVYAGTQIIYELETVLPIYAEVIGEDENAYNRRWYQTTEGYIHSTNVQPVLNQPNRPRTITTPQLGEITVPFADALANPKTGSPEVHRLYYSTTHWVQRSQLDDDGKVWFELLNDRSGALCFVPATAVRLIPADELSPISPRAADKQISLDTTAQTITAFENGRPVFTTRISSGGTFTDQTTGAIKDFRTPLGEYRVNRKRPSRHMAAGDGAADDAYDLPGVPWVSYFNGGMALHGTYWHNDFGRPWSHGCINLLPQDAKWFYRWTTPVVPADRELVEALGTVVTVV